MTHAIPKMICHRSTSELVDKRFLGVFTKATKIFVLKMNFKQKKSLKQLFFERT